MPLPQPTAEIAHARRRPYITPRIPISSFERIEQRRRQFGGRREDRVSRAGGLKQGAVHATPAIARQRWQATACRSFTASSGGTSRSQISCAWRQRWRNAHPEGTAPPGGGSPAAASFWSATPAPSAGARVGSGTAASSAWVYG